MFRDSVFLRNRAGITGSGVDVLDGSAFTCINCLFVGNVSNLGPDTIGMPDEFNRRNGSGALAVFEDSVVRVENSTFTGNWNGVDDNNLGSLYRRSIFYGNDLRRPGAPGRRYDLDVLDGRGVSRSFIGVLRDASRSAYGTSNAVGVPDPDFNENYEPQNDAYKNVGFRPW